MSGFLEELETRRAGKGLSVEAFARSLQVSEPTYSRIRRGLYPPSARFIKGALRLYPELAEIVAMESRDEASETSEEGAA